MSNPKWTPGPWLADPDGRYALSSDGNEILALAFDRPAVHANTHLIAAAPELYAALRGLISEDQERDMRAEPGTYAEEWHTALTALAKARGETQ
jgi:hypothetical protein